MSIAKINGGVASILNPFLRAIALSLLSIWKQFCR